MFEVDTLVSEAEVAIKSGNRAQAISLLRAATRKVYRHGPARRLLDQVALDLFKEAMAVRDSGDMDGCLARLVQSIELNPTSQETRSEFARLLAQKPTVRDMTTECLIFPDADRADYIYRGAIETCIDFATLNGIDGDIIEFGVLAGWTARRFAETMRDFAFMGDLWLFDSFMGLPRSKHQIDLDSYDVQRGIWQGEMAIPQSIIEELGSEIDVHIRNRLSSVISPERIHTRRGFYSESLKANIPARCSIAHIDCDLYSSTVEVFEACERDNVFQDGTILMFDDWNCNRGNPKFGQRRAFSEFLERNTNRYSSSHFFNYGYNCAAFIIHTV